MEERARLRVNLSQREFEVEGSEGFVREFAPRIEELLERIASGALPVEPEAEPAAAPAPRVNGARSEPEGLGSFGEFMLRFPSSATDVDRMLGAGFYVQHQAPDDAFSTGDANKRLTEQGVKLGNPSQCVKQSVLAKRVFMVQRGRYRVSQQGRQHLRQLMGGVVPE